MRIDLFSLSFFRIKTFAKRTFKSKFVRNVAVVASGTAGAQAITVAFSPIITRLYGPEAFGVLGTFLALTTVITPIAALAYPIAIVLPKEDSEARAIVKLSVSLALSIGTAVFFVFLFGGNWLALKLQVQEIQPFFLLIPIVIIFSAFTGIARQWLIRKKQFHITARIAVVNALLINCLKTGFGLFKPLAAVLIFLSVFGNVIYAVLLAWGVKISAKNFQNQTKNIKNSYSIWTLAKKYYDFPLYRAPQIFINAISQSLPILMLAAFFGPASAGFYALGKKLLALPAGLIGGSVQDVFYPRITEAAHKGERLTGLIIKATLGLAAVGFFPFFVVVVFGPWLFEVVFGSEWVTAGEYARWLALWVFFGFINRPSVSSIPLLNLQGFFLIYEIVSVILRAFVLFIGFRLFKSDIMAIMLFSLVGVLLNFSLVLFSIYRSHCFYSKKKALS